jgi:hypothetical protein
VATLDVSGDVNFRNNIVTNNNSIDVFNTTATTVNFASAATTKENNEYIANCYPNAGQSDFVQGELVEKAFGYMVEAKLVTAQEVDRYYQSAIDTISQFAIFITTMKNSVQAAELFKRFMTNPYYGMSLTGPANVKGCKAVIYKPSNHQFAVQGGVSSSARNLKLSVQTIQTNLKALNWVSATIKAFLT